MTRRNPWIFLSLALALGGIAHSQGRFQQGPSLDRAIVEADRSIMGEIRGKSRIMEDLEYLCDMIGPRLTGSEQMKRANDWTMKKFQEYGLQNAHLEKWTIPHSWQRGSATARIVAPAVHPLTVAAAGWSPGTNGAVRGEVVHVNVREASQLDQYKGKLRNAIVLTSPPADVPPPSAPRVDGIPMKLPSEEDMARAPAGRFDPARQQLTQQINEMLKQEGAACVLRDSRKEHGLLDMSGGGRNFMPGSVPIAYINHEGYTLLWRLLKRGKVEVEINLTNSFSEGPVEVYNTVAELPGGEKSDEVVILGAHLDSWDLATGATDNGTGSMVVLEAARSLKASGVIPRRTIRFVLFNGEEQGLVGSSEYVKAHANEMEKISAVLVHDTGTGRVTSIGLQGRYDCAPMVEMVTAPLLRSIGFEGVRGSRTGGTDHASFDRAGIPAFYCIQDRAEYNKTHHSNSDTFDKVWKDDLLQGAMVMAVWAYNVASIPDMMPRRVEAR